MDIAFISGFGPIGTADSRSHDFWAGTLGIAFTEPGPGYFHTEHLEGAKACAIWPLSQAAQAIYGTAEWPDTVRVPQAWVEFDVATPDAVRAAVDELRSGGHELLSDVTLEPWGQWTSRLLSPEGLIVGVTYTPWMRQHES